MEANTNQNRLPVRHSPLSNLNDNSIDKIAPTSENPGNENGIEKNELIENYTGIERKDTYERTNKFERQEVLSPANVSSSYSSSSVESVRNDYHCNSNGVTYNRNYEVNRSMPSKKYRHPIFASAEDLKEEEILKEKEANSFNSYYISDEEEYYQRQSSVDRLPLLDQPPLLERLPSLELHSSSNLSSKRRLSVDQQSSPDQISSSDRHPYLYQQSSPAPNWRSCKNNRFSPYSRYSSHTRQDYSHTRHEHSATRREHSHTHHEHSHIRREQSHEQHKYRHAHHEDSPTRSEHAHAHLGHSPLSTAIDSNPLTNHRERNESNDLDQCRKITFNSLLNFQILEQREDRLTISVDVNGKQYGGHLKLNLSS